MPGHKDPEGVIKKDAKGLLFVEVVEAKKEVPKVDEVEFVVEAPKNKKKGK